MGYYISPYLMQRTTFKILQTLFEGLKIKFFLYLDDILLIGRPKVLYKVAQILKDSSFKLNDPKSVYTLTRRINYLGLRIDSKSSRLRLTSAAIATIKNSIVQFSQKVMTTKDWERWACLINFYAIALRLPFFLVQLAYLRNKFSLYLAALMTTGYVFYFDYFYQIVTVDACPTGIGMCGIRKSLAMPVYLQQYYAEWLVAFGASLQLHVAVAGDCVQALVQVQKGKIPIAILPLGLPAQLFSVLCTINYDICTEFN
jgi:hypothetical protein